MRFVLVSALVFVVLSGLGWLYPDLARQGYHEVASQTGKLLNEKEVRISGLSVLARADILRDLPLDRSVVWWQLNHHEIERALERNPLIEKVVVSRCEAVAVRCFDVSIAERQPAFIAALGDRVWLLGEDGGFITPIPRKQFDERGAHVLPGQRTPVLIDGLLSESSSPDIVKGRIQYVKSVIGAVESETNLSVRWLGIRDNGETAIKFKGYDFDAIFDAGDRELGKMREEARRLKTVLSQFSDRLSDVARVDLAFDKVAVAKLKADLVIPK